MDFHLFIIKYLRTSVLHGLAFVVVYELLCGTCSGGILILRQRNLSKQCLLRFLCPNIKIFYCMCCEAYQGLQHKFGPCRTFTKLDHAERLSLSTLYMSASNNKWGNALGADRVSQHF